MKPTYRRPWLAAATAIAIAASGVTVTAVTSAQAASGCQVTYTISSQWPGGFNTNVTITNLGSPISSWSLAWSFGSGQSITQLWNGSYTQSGSHVTVTNAAYNGSIATGGNTSFGFQGTYSGANAVPTDFALNGVSCGGSGSPSPSTSASASPSASASASATASASASASPSATPSGTPTGTPGCPSAAVFCDGFENQSGTVPSGRWSVVTPNCSGTGAASITSAMAHTGGKSLAIAGGSSYCDHVFADDTSDMAAAAPTWYVRFWMRHTTPLPTNHTTFLAMNDSAANNTDLRLGAQNGALVWNRQSDDATLPDQSPVGVSQSVVVPTGAWECVEFAVSGTTGHVDTWYNGALVPGLTADGTVTQSVNDQWGSGSGANWRPKLTDLKFGWENYSNGTDGLWFDDVVLSTSRIGC